MLKFFLFLALSFATGSFSQASCIGDFVSDTETQTQLLEEDYQRIDRKGFEIAPINRPFVLKGSKREAVLLVHGFMGSPWEMSSIAKKLNALGYTTYSALIPGYGATAKIANKYHHEDWSQWYGEEIARLETCYSKVHLVGFSTGSLLATDYVTKNPLDTAIQSVTLISPYYEIHSAFFAVLQSGATSLLHQISVNFVYHVLGFPDVGVMLAKPEAYLHNVPLQAAEEVVALGRKVQKRQVEDLPLSIPALVFISGDDLVIDQDVADQLTSKIFADRRLIYRKANATSSTRVPHHLMVKEVSPVVRSTENRIVEFYQSL